MELLNQPFNGQLGNRLIELLESTDYEVLNIIVAFAKNSGVLRVKHALEGFRARGGKANVYVGVDLGGTSYEALESLLLLSDSLSVIHSENSQTFHPKVYQFIGKSKGLVVVGSHNLTAGGLWTNFESSVIIPVLGSASNEVGLQSSVDEYIAKLVSLGDSFMPIETMHDVNRLLENGYILREVAAQVCQAKAAARGASKKRLFGNGVSAKLPGVANSKGVTKGAVSPSPPETTTVPHSEEGQTIWFETRAMTGGSRNILDLSMKSLVERGSPVGTPFEHEDPRFMSGGVEFFGLNPTATDEIKTLTINFEGVDYSDNAILFPVGERANGTWRLQIKGVSQFGRRITEAFREKGEDPYLQHKIVTFTKVQDDYYFMSVFPESELDNFSAASRILARNGTTRNAKLLGLL